MKRLVTLVVVLLAALLVAGCGGQAEPTPTKTPRPTATFTPLPTAAAVLPAVESSAPGPGGSVQTSPLPTPASLLSPLATPAAGGTPEPVPTLSFDAQAPIPALAANLACGEGCTAGNPQGAGTVIFNLETGQLNTWVASLDPLEGQEYEGWLVEGEQAASTGRFNTGTDGTASDFIVLVDLKDRPWSSFVLTIEPEPDDDPGPVAEHAIGGPLRETVMGEAIYTRFNVPCQQCHGEAAEGVTGPALAGIDRPFDQFLAAVRNHPNATFGEEAISTRDLQHMYAWLKAAAP